MVNIAVINTRQRTNVTVGNGPISAKPPSRHDLAKKNSANFRTIREVVATVSELRRGGVPIDLGSNLHRAIEQIYESRGQNFNFDVNNWVSELERVENELLTAVANSPGDWVEQDPASLQPAVAKQPESKALNKADLARLLTDYEDAIAKRVSGQEAELQLAQQYKISPDQVRDWIERLKETQVRLQENGLNQEESKLVAPKAVARKERLRDDLKRIGVDEAKIEAIVQKVVEGYDKPAEVTREVGLVVDDSSAEIKREVLHVAKTQAERLAVEVEVVSRIHNQSTELVAELEQELQISQPGLDITRQQQRLHQFVVEASEKVWKGEYPSLEVAEVNVGEDEQIRLVPIGQAIQEIIDVKDDAVVIAIKTASQKISLEQRQNMVLAAKAEFIAKSEDITDKIIELNPNIDYRVVVNYTEEVTKITTDLLPHGHRQAWESAGGYGQDKSAVASTNIVFRVMSGINRHESLVEATSEFENAGGDSAVQIEASPLTRASNRFLNDLNQNPLLDRGITMIRKSFVKSIASNTTIVQGVTSFVANDLGFSTIFGIETMTAIPAVMGYFSAGGTFSGAIAGISQAGGIGAWINGLVVAGGATVGATGEVAAVAGATAATTGAVTTTVVAGGVAATAGATGFLATVASIPGIGWIVAAVVAAGTAVIKIGKKAIGWLKEKGIDLNKINPFSYVKRFLQDLGLGKLGSSLVAVPITLAGFLVTIPFLALSAAMAGLMTMISPIVIGLFIFIFAYQVLVPNTLGSALVPSREFLMGNTGNNQAEFTNVDPIYGEACESTLACVALEALFQNKFNRVVPTNVQMAATVLRALIGRFPAYDIARFITVMVYNTNRFDAFQCIGYAIAATSGLTTSPSWPALYAGTQPGCVRVAPENAGLGDMIVFPVRSGHYHIGVLVVVRPDGSAMMYDVNTDGNGQLHKWPIANLASFVAGNNSRNQGQPLTILRCGI